MAIDTRRSRRGGRGTPRASTRAPSRRLRELSSRPTAGTSPREGIFGAGEPGSDGQWPDGRASASGIVMGAVQSGKTASMLGAAASEHRTAGVDMVVVLAGTRHRALAAVARAPAAPARPPGCTAQSAERARRRILVRTEPGLAMDDEEDPVAVARLYALSTEPSVRRASRDPPAGPIVGRGAEERSTTCGR